MVEVLGSDREFGIPGEPNVGITGYCLVDGRLFLILFELAEDGKFVRDFLVEASFGDFLGSLSHRDWKMPEVLRRCWRGCSKSQGCLFGPVGCFSLRTGKEDQFLRIATDFGLIRLRGPCC